MTVTDLLILPLVGIGNHDSAVDTDTKSYTLKAKLTYSLKHTFHLFCCPTVLFMLRVIT
jgi:hypothetical protein